MEFLLQSQTLYTLLPLNQVLRKACDLWPLLWISLLMIMEIQTKFQNLLGF